MSKAIPTWMDHHLLNFWLWSSLHDANAYLSSFEEMMSHMVNMPSDGEGISRWNATRMIRQNKSDLEKYHFVMSLGSLMRHLNNVAHLFPELSQSYEAATHITKEGLAIRNMIEHADKNFIAADKGTPRGGFVRKVSVGSEIPGNRHGTSDATAVIVDGQGHWIGGRLNVQTAIKEIEAISYDAASIPTPTENYIRRQVDSCS